MTTDELVALSARFDEELFNRNNLDVIEEIIADDFINHDPLPGMPADKAGVYETAHTFRAAFPDWRFENEQIIAQGDVVAHRVIWRGTHTGTFLGIAPTGAKVEARSFDFLRFRDGKMVERWSLFDTTTFMAQLGVKA